jgi:carbamate kinase
VRVVIALGGNALLQRGQPMDAGTQRANAEVAAAAIARVARDHQVVVTHGNGPQVGMLAMQGSLDPDVEPYPLDVLDAETEGMIGYILEQELGHHLRPEQLATVLTQVVVSPTDPAFVRPTKPVGRRYDATSRDVLAARHADWRFTEEGGTWRRVVPSPEPLAIVEIETIRLLVDRGITVICAGGGGIPVVRDPDGCLRGVEAVIDKDLSAELLARSVDADALVLLTDVDGVHRGWGGADSRLVASASVAELRALDLPAGSMGPKVEAICRFVEGRPGKVAGIGRLDDAGEVLAGTAGPSVRSAGLGASPPVGHAGRVEATRGR